MEEQRSNFENKKNNEVDARQRKPGLGRGLDALFSSNTKSHSSIGQPSDQPKEGGPRSEGRQVENIVVSIPISEIVPNKEQPRKQFDQEKLEELAASIVAHGLLQPILLQKIQDGHYQIIAGERRFKASQMAGLKEVQAMIVPIESERKLLELALLENIQRTDLSVVEEARAYASLVEDFKCTHETISNSLGKSRSHITNCLRILKMPDFVLNLLESQDISFGHAKVIAGLEDPSFWAQMVIEKGLTVRMLERAILLEKESQITQQDTSEQEDMYEDTIRQRGAGLSGNEGQKIKDSQLRLAVTRFNNNFSSLGKLSITEEKDGTLYIITHCRSKAAALQILSLYNSPNTEFQNNDYQGSGSSGL